LKGPMSQTVYISVGSNTGDKLANCRKGIAAVAGHTKMALAATARFYKTAPMDYTDQDWFVNTAISITTTLSPKILLQALHAVQREIGRTKTTIRFGPRVLDLDILFYGDQIVASENLTIPHPRMHQRRFVLQPLCDLAPDWIHPVLKKDMQTLLLALEPDTQPVERLTIE